MRLPFCSGRKKKDWNGNALAAQQLAFASPIVQSPHFGLSVAERFQPGVLRASGHAGRVGVQLGREAYDWDGPDRQTVLSCT